MDVGFYFLLVFFFAHLLNSTSGLEGMDEAPHCLSFDLVESINRAKLSQNQAAFVT